MAHRSHAALKSGFPLPKGAVLAGGAAVIFALDVATPADLPVDMLYMGVLVAAALLQDRPIVLAVALFLTGLEGAGWLLSPPTGDFWTPSVFGRLMTVGGLWLTAVLFHVRWAVDDRAQAARDRLTLALEQLEDGISLWDSDDRMVVSNAAYRTLSGKGADKLKRGCAFEGYIRESLRLGAIELPADMDAETWIQARLERHRSGSSSFELRRNGRWMHLREERLSDGGTLIVATDITRTKESERRFAEKSAELEATFAAIEQGICVFDDRLKLRACNPYLLKLLRYPEALGEPGVDFEEWVRVSYDKGDLTGNVDKETAVAGCVAFARKALEEPQHFESNLASGRVVDMRRTVLPGGGFVGVCADISDRVAAQEAVRESEERFRNFAESASDWLWESDADDIMTYTSENMQSLSGVSPDKVLGRRIADLRPAALSDDRAWKSHLDLIAKRQPIRDSVIARPRTVGQRNFVRVNGQPRFDKSGSFLGYRGSARVVTAEIEAQHRADLTHERLLVAINSMTDGFALWDEDGRLAVVNPQMQDFYGRRREVFVVGARFDETVGAMADLAAGHDGPEARQAWLDKMVAYHRTPEASLDLQGRDGRYFRLTKQRTPSNWTVSLMTDVTEAQRAAIAMRTARDEIESASRARSAFFANMSHELRTPLNSIIGYADLIAGASREKNASQDGVGAAPVGEFANVIKESGAHLLELINDILDASKLESGMLKLEEEFVDICEIARSSCKFVEHRAVESGITLDCEWDNELPAICADRRRMKQVLLNLLSNALKFTGDGGAVTLRIVADADGLLIEVSDNGIGMRPEDVSKALMPFAQIESGRGRAHEGTGLGLPLSKSMVELHGGTFEMESQLGQGTTARIRLPSYRLGTAVLEQSGSRISL